VSGGVDLNNDGVVAGDELVPLTMQWFKSLVDQLDGDMQVWTIYMNTHCAWCVDDLTPTVRSLQQAGVPFFGPTMRADGVYQLYLELPAHHYVDHSAQNRTPPSLSELYACHRVARSIMALLHAPRTTACQPAQSVLLCGCPCRTTVWFEPAGRGRFSRLQRERRWATRSTVERGRWRSCAGGLSCGQRAVSQSVGQSVSQSVSRGVMESLSCPYSYNNTS